MKSRYTSHHKLVEGEFLCESDAGGTPDFGIFDSGSGAHVTGLIHDERGTLATDSAILGILS
jgi:hypothetical protein